MTLNDKCFYCEVTFYITMMIIFIILQIYNNIFFYIENIIYIIFMSISFGWLFALRWILKKYDTVVHKKMFEKYFVKGKSESRHDGYKRKGIYKVIVLWILYLAFIALIKQAGLLTWQLFLCGACIMFILNSFFTRKLCLLSLFFLHNKNNCCKNCGICSWDNAIFASALIFAPNISKATTILNLVIIVISFCEMIIWEFNYHKYPYRFYPETNAALTCDKCIKKCKYYKNGGF